MDVQTYHGAKRAMMSAVTGEPTPVKVSMADPVAGLSPCVPSMATAKVFRLEHQALHGFVAS